MQNKVLKIMPIREFETYKRLDYYTMHLIQGK